jgi:uncharacterized protein (DUF2141 family)
VRRLGVRAFALLLAAEFAHPASAAELAVEVRGLRSDAGEVRVGLFDTPRTFATDAGKIAEIVLARVAEAES